MHEPRMLASGWLVGGLVTVWVRLPWSLGGSLVPTAEVTAWSPPKMLVQWESGGDAGGEMGRVKMTPETYVSFTNLQNRFFYAILIIIWHFIKSSTINL